MADSGSIALVASVMRRIANLPNASCAGTAGAMSGHHATTGMSGSRKGITTLSAWPASGPDSRSTTNSPAPASAPTRSCASSRGLSAYGSPRIVTMMRLGCSWLASLAASMDSSSMASLSGAMMSVSTRPIATAPIFSRSSSSFLLTAVVVVSGKSTIICAAPPHRFALHRRRRGSLWPPPFPAGAAQHLQG
ncbi:Uncharacterised protein [Mycobacterium tuberculosis]|uniref:Uncharacterized protein n=2 Tax=Mycobacterium tuberculosis TaxID=1773 RepID=A0A654U5V7_MYCTX|nr:Uncharacterised protein [Mycobacterium tuberculosis]CFS59639.1 Uncharacterised protein [Mycobacterium tuberculosis]CKR31708.1 Uncharacterised protein [Mycobacterium tuberculosis]CKR64270.1 Uncharacterised protein [Mycobacterium tuberculosis]CKV46619.1 Uncharacterised protein [Mycobacterium tuberculosis]